jgi:osmotically inducible lipoprotein OsmB
MKRLIGVLSLTILLGGCAAPLTAREKGALGGGALGAGAGAIIGNAMGDHRTGKGALIGGALGALGGAAVGDQMEGQNQRQNAQASDLEQQRLEIERQRRELDDMRRDRYGDRGYDSRRSDPNYDRRSDPNYDRGYDRSSSDRDYQY